MTKITWGQIEAERQLGCVFVATAIPAGHTCIDEQGIAEQMADNPGTTRLDAVASNVAAEIEQGLSWLNERDGNTDVLASAYLTYLGDFGDLAQNARRVAEILIAREPA